jgi:hypothetical protein
MDTTASRAPMGTTLLDLLWQLQGAEELSEEQLVETILSLLAEGRIRLTGTYRDILVGATVRTEPDA